MPLLQVIVVVVKEESGGNERPSGGGLFAEVGSVDYIHAGYCENGSWHLVTHVFS
jgi:hypothetical protein